MTIRNKVAMGVMFAVFAAACSSATEPVQLTIAPVATTTTVAPTTTTLPPTTTTVAPTTTEATTTTVQAVSAAVGRRIAALDLVTCEDCTPFFGLPVDEVTTMIEGTCIMAEDYQSGTEMILDLLVVFEGDMLSQEQLGGILDTMYTAEEWYDTLLCESDHANTVTFQAWEYVLEECAAEACEEEPAAA
jgi:ABC-type transport system substrate-binding protein